MKPLSASFVFLFLALCAAGTAPAQTCIDGRCHQAITEPKYLHGPVAAEEAGAEGCVSCHVPAGRPCTAETAGEYRYKTDKDRLCLLCHERGTGTQHTRASSKCLSCHNPHNSGSSMNMLRAG